MLEIPKTPAVMNNCGDCVLFTSKLPDRCPAVKGVKPLGVCASAMPAAAAKTLA